MAYHYIRGVGGDVISIEVCLSLGGSGKGGIKLLIGV